MITPMHLTLNASTGDSLEKHGESPILQERHSPLRLILVPQLLTAGGIGPAMSRYVLNPAKPEPDVRVHVHRFRPRTNNHGCFSGVPGGSLTLRSAFARSAPSRARAGSHGSRGECRTQYCRFGSALQEPENLCTPRFSGYRTIMLYALSFAATLNRGTPKMGLT